MGGLPEDAKLYFGFKKNSTSIFPKIKWVILVVLGQWENPKQNLNKGDISVRGNMEVGNIIGLYP